MDIRYGRKRSGIKRELVKKLEDWLASIEDESVRKVAAKNVIVTGGSIASMLLGEKINDFDLYFRTKKAAVTVAEYYVKQFNEVNKPEQGAVDDRSCIPVVVQDSIVNIKGETEERVVISIKSSGVAGENAERYEYFESQPEDSADEYVESMQHSEGGKKYRPVFLSQNAITLSNKVQLVIRFYGGPDEIHDNYDFVHAMNYYDYDKEHLELKPEALECLLSRTLVYAGSLYPIASIFRMKKFLERGWRITAGQQLKIMWQISEIDMSDPEVLKEQLTGVDMAYMWQLIEALKSVEPEKINAAYVAKIIDKIFD